MYLLTNEEKWNTLHNSTESRHKYPNESVVRFVKSSFRSPDDCHILDLGCGSGRHVFFLFQEGYQVSAIDFSKSCIDYVNSVLRDNNMNEIALEGSITALPYPDESYDGIICHGGLLYLFYVDIVQAAKEIYRTLKPGGKAFIVVRHIEDMRYGKGEEIEKNTFKLSDNFTNEEGLVIHFFDSDEIQNVFAEFTNIQIGIQKHSMNSFNEYNSDFLITLTK